MFGIDSPELLVIAIVALVIIGPKELPNLLRSWGKWMSQARAMASEFRGHVDDMVRQSELDEVKKQLESAPGLDLQALDPTKEIRSAIQDGMAEGQKAIEQAKSTLDNPLAEPESAPQIAADTAPAEAPRLEATPAEPEPPSVAAAETVPAAPAEPAPLQVAEVAPAAVPAPEDKPAKAAVAG